MSNKIQSNLLYLCNHTSNPKKIYLIFQKLIRRNHSNSENLSCLLFSQCLHKSISNSIIANGNELIFSPTTGLPIGKTKTNYKDVEIYYVINPTNNKKQDEIKEL